MTFYRFEKVHRDSAGRVLKRSFRYVERQGSRVLAPPASEDEIQLTPEEEEMLQDMKKSLQALERQVEGLRTAARAQPASEAMKTLDSIATRLDAAADDLSRISLEHKSLSDRLNKIELALSRLHSAAAATANHNQEG